MARLAAMFALWACVALSTLPALAASGAQPDRAASASASAAAGTAGTAGTDIGFQELRIPNGPEPPLTVGVWAPTDAPRPGRRWPLIVFSHGGGGSYDAHRDTAIALAQAGFVVAAVSHAGDTFDDQSKVLQLWRRPAQLRRLVDSMLGDWPRRAQLDAGRIGAFGFSNGGFTVLVAAGGVPELSAIGPYCHDHPDHDLCRALQQAGVSDIPGSIVPAGAWVRDPRIRAVVVAAPAFGFAFDRAGLDGVVVPVQLWRAADDRHQPAPFYEDAVRAALPRPPDYRVVANAGHYDFLPPCEARLARRAPDICRSEPGFDRAAFHRQFDAEVVRFFLANLR